MNQTSLLSLISVSVYVIISAVERLLKNKYSFHNATAYDEIELDSTKEIENIRTCIERLETETKDNKKAQTI